MKQLKPVSLTFYQLAVSLQVIHVWNKPDVDRLHDLWLKGAPTPDSRLLDMKNYDPRTVQAGNVEKRLIIPPSFVDWFNDVAKRRGLNLQPETAYKALDKISRTFNRVNYS
jgi:hypothetical protein